jgi:hypothetical protein
MHKFKEPARRSSGLKRAMENRLEQYKNEVKREIRAAEIAAMPSPKSTTQASEPVSGAPCAH